MGLKHSLAACLVLLVLASSLASASPSDITVKLNMNDTSSTVHVPGVGDMPSSQASGTWTNPDSFYIANYVGGVIYGLVFAYQNPIHIAASPFMGGHMLEMSAASENSRILLAFTRGNWDVIENRMPMIRWGTFFNYMYPSFGYGLGKDNDVKMLLEYDDDMDVNENLILNPGSHTLTVEHLGEQDGKEIIRIRRA